MVSLYPLKPMLLTLESILLFSYIKLCHKSHFVSTMMTDDRLMFKETQAFFLSPYCLIDNTWYNRKKEKNNTHNKSKFMHIIFLIPCIMFKITCRCRVVVSSKRYCTVEKLVIITVQVNVRARKRTRFVFVLQRAFIFVLQCMPFIANCVAVYFDVCCFQFALALHFTMLFWYNINNLT